MPTFLRNLAIMFGFIPSRQAHGPTRRDEKVRQDYEAKR